MLLLLQAYLEQSGEDLLAKPDPFEGNVWFSYGFTRFSLLHAYIEPSGEDLLAKPEPFE